MLGYEPVRQHFPTSVLNASQFLRGRGLLSALVVIVVGYVTFATCVLAAAAWPLLLDPQRRAVPFCAPLLRLALAVVVTRRIGLTIVTLIEGMVIADTVNDFDRARLFLGPLTGRTTQLSGSALAGISANPMIRTAPSQLPLATVADYAWHPGGYDPPSAARALAAVAGVDAAALRPLVTACSAWPPSAPQTPNLSMMMAAVLAGGPTGRLSTAFAEMASAPARIVDPASRLTEALGPSLSASAATARVGELAEAEAYDDANVLRSVVPPFVTAVLDRTPSAWEETGRT